MSVYDAAHREVVRRYFNANFVTWKNPDVVEAHLAAYVGEHFNFRILNFHTKSGVWKVLDDDSFDFNTAIFCLFFGLLRKLFSTLHKLLCRDCTVLTLRRGQNDHARARDSDRMLKMSA